MRICCKLGLRPIYISIVVKGTNLDGTRLRRYPAVSKAYPQKGIGNNEKQIINLTMSIKV